MVCWAMVRALAGKISRTPRRTRMLAFVAIALCVAFLFERFLLPNQPARWHPVTVEFCGFTNLQSGKCAIFAIQNQSRQVLKLRDFNYMEYYRRPVLGSGNTNRRYAAGTNFVLHVGQRANLALPVSEEGSSWNVYFEFTCAGLQADVANYLQKSQGAWVRFVPEVLQNTRQIKVIFYLSPFGGRGHGGVHGTSARLGP